MKKFISLLLAFLILTATPIASLADSGVLDGETVKVNLLQKIKFTYQSDSESTATCYYTDDYFANSSYIYNQHLSTMAMSFSFASFNSGYTDYPNGDSNAREFLVKIGVPEQNIESNDWYSLKPTNDSVGVIAGNKPINVNGENYTLVAVAVRGGGYEREWASNFTIGATGQHQGFAEAKDITFDFLKSYIENQNITGKVKFLFTGYSRGAAVVNLIGGALDDGYVLSTDISYELSDVYTYSFESPAGAYTENLEGTSRYDNIFNIINPNDPVPYVAPFSLGFSRYGIDVLVPTAESHPEEYQALKEKMLEFYFSFDGKTTYGVDNFQMKKLGLNNWLPGGDPIGFVVDDTKNNYSQSMFLSNYVSILADEFIVTRDNYVASYEDEIREVCSVVFGCSGEQQQIMMQSLISQAQNNWGSLVLSYLWHVGMNPFGSEEDALIIVSGWLKTAIADAGITDYDEATIESAGVALADLMLALIISHPNYFTTAVMNATCLGEAHFPELCFAWLQSVDTYYNSDVQTTLNSNAYRIVYINGEADVNAYAKDGSLVVSYNNDILEDIGSGYNYGIDNEQFYAVFPIDAEYTINISNDSDTVVDYIVKEYNSSVGITRVVEFKDEAFSSEEFLVGTIPMYTEREISSGAPSGSTVTYTLIKSNGTVSNPDSDISRNTMFKVNATSSNDEYGTVAGSGTYKYGSLATIEAKPVSGCNFVGWYENNALVSLESVYTFNVYEAHNFVAIFESTELTPKAGNGVSVVNRVVYGMWDNLTLEKAKELFENSETLTVNTDKFIGTGNEFTYFEKTYKIIILGDLDGNGVIDATDYLRIKNNFLGYSSLEGDWLVAADVYQDGVITSADYLRIKGHFLKSYNIYPNKVS